MALDNANFIAELSITDPPGTDPLSQGDDQIRTIKRATFQSFPNIDAAVTLTAAQMNLAAIKNESNTFTANPQIFFDTNLQFETITATVTQRIRYFRGGFPRWELNCAVDADNNNFQFRRLDGTGTLVDIPWECDLTTGIIDFAQVPTVLGAPLWIAGEIRMFVATAVLGTNWFLADGTNGTVDLTDRVVIGSGTDSPGVTLAPNLSAISIVDNSDSTVLTEAQLAAHDHSILGSGPPGLLQGLQESTARAFAGLGSVTPAFIDQTGFGDNLVQNTGQNQGHTHGISPLTVVENGSTRQTVRPFSRVVEMHQYVP